jgi:hypothetical protein
MHAFWKVMWKTIDCSAIEFEHKMLVHDVQFSEKIITLHRFDEVVETINVNQLTMLHIEIAIA